MLVYVSGEKIMEKQEEFKLSKIFLDVASNLSLADSKKSIKLNIKDYGELEQTLEDYLTNILGYKSKFDYSQYYPEIRKYFENILNNGFSFNKDVVENIKEYEKKFIDIFNSHYYLTIFTVVMRRIYSPSYSGRIDYGNTEAVNNYDIFISHLNNSLIFGHIARKNEDSLPPIYVSNIDEFDDVLKNYIDTIRTSSSYYNILARNEIYASEEDKIKALIESTIFNVTNADAAHIIKFFRKYTLFLKEHTFCPLSSPQKIGFAFNDDLYVMYRKSEPEYETPYYFSFMLPNRRIELPVVRIGIKNEDGFKTAHILATQSSQRMLNFAELNKVNTEIKSIIPRDKYFRFFNPSHYISILITFGILNGAGIKNIEIVEMLPLRYHKTIIDRCMSDDEAERYQTRLTNKNIITYMRLFDQIKGIKILDYPDGYSPLTLILEDNIECPNDELQKLYNYGYELGSTLKEKTLKLENY